MRFGSVCSGIEAASVAWNPLGFDAAWLAEIEPFPCALLAHHYPDVPNLGDMTAIAARVASGEVEAPDLFCGGTPCQAFSVAGLRNSLDDARGNLSITFCEIADAIDNARSVLGLPAAIVFWENVPGVLSTKDNAFGCFLAGLAGEDEALVAPGGKWTDAGYVHGPKRTVAWRVFDAQHFGLAQRRRRVFVVASARADFDPTSVLFEFAGVRRDTAPSRKEGQEVTGCLDASLGRSRGAGTPPNAITGCLDARSNRSVGIQDAAAGFLQPVNGSDVVGSLDTQCGGQKLAHQSIANGHVIGTITHPANRSNPRPGDPCHPIAAGAHAPAVAYNIYGGNKRADRPEGGFYVKQEETSKTLDAASGLNPTCAQGGVAIAFSRNDDGRDATEELAPTMRVAGRAGGMLESTVPAAFGMDLSQKAEGISFKEEVATTVCDLKHPGHGNHTLASMQVRRLTPVECERLQGFPDNYTLVPHRNKPAADGPRYKALGNSWAVPVVRWIGERIKVNTNKGNV